MKKILFIGILTILSINASFAQVKFGFTGGLNFSGISWSGEEGRGIEVNDGMIITGIPIYYDEPKFGFQAGFVMDYSITKNFSIIPELLYSQRGHKYSFPSGTFQKISNVKGTLTINYLQLPVNAVYKFYLGKNSDIFIFAGPYVSYGISGKLKMECSKFFIDDMFSITDFHGTLDIDIGSGEDEIKPFDFGINAGIGYQFKKIFFKLQCNPGLYIYNNSKDNNIKNFNVAVTAGHFF